MVIHATTIPNDQKSKHSQRCYSTPPGPLADLRVGNGEGGMETARGEREWKGKKGRVGKGEGGMEFKVSLHHWL